MDWRVRRPEKTGKRQLEVVKQVLVGRRTQMQAQDPSQAAAAVVASQPLLQKSLPAFLRVKAVQRAAAMTT